MQKMLALLLGLALSGAAGAQMKGHDMKDSGGMQMTQPTGTLTDGEIRKVDKDAQKITIRHGPLPSLDMPGAMTMVYRVKDPSMLGQVKPGDKVKFEAQKVGGAFTVTRIAPAKQ